MTGKKIKVTLVKSPIGCRQPHRETVRGLGLRRLHQTVEVVDSPQVRGMLRSIAYLVRTEG
jgi:large subunit ribosomal protein L30